MYITYVKDQVKYLNIFARSGGGRKINLPQLCKKYKILIIVSVFMFLLF